MTTLAVGASVTVAVRDGGTVTIATNGGLASAVVTPTGGSASTASLGPLSERRILGPYSEGATLLITNTNCASFDYDAESAVDPSDSQPVIRASMLRNWRAARGKVIAGTADAVICCLGDSKTFGRGSNAADYNGCKAKAYPRQLASLLTSAGVAARESSIMGTGRAGLANFLLAETRVAVGAGWAEFTSDSVGGFMLWNNTDTSTLAFTPTQTLDTIEIWDSTNSTQGAWTVNVDGGAALATVSAGAGGNQLRKTTVNPTRGTHTINIQRTGTGGYIIIPAIVTRDSLARSVLVHNMGSSGSQAGFWNTSANVLGVPLIDHAAFIGPFAAANTAGMYFDNTHESGAGYADEAKRIASVLLA